MTDRHRQVKYEQLPDTQTDTETATATTTERERRGTGQDTNRNRNQAGTKRTDPACRQVQCAKRDAAENQKQKKSKKNYCVCDHEGCGLLTRRRWSARAWNVVVSQQQRRRRWRCRWRWKRRRKWSRVR